MALERFSKHRRELSVDEIIVGSLRLYRRDFKSFFLPYLFMGFANSVLMFWAQSTMPPPPLFGFGIFGPEMIVDWLANLLTVLLVVGVVGWILSTLVLGYSVRYASNLIEGELSTPKSAFVQIVPKLPLLLAAGLIADLLVILGVLLLILPGIIFAVMFSLVAPIIILEDKGVLKCLSRSKRLVSKRWTKTFILLLLVVLLIFVVSSFGSVLGLALGPLGYAASSILTAITAPLYPIAITYLYHSMKAREGAKEEEPSEEARPHTPVKYCIECGVTLNPLAVYCPNCGARQP